jgi:GNAT superfamily N-acetyltransferase
MRIRPGTVSDIGAISHAYFESWKTTYEGLVPDPFVRGMTLEAATRIFTDSLKPNRFSYFLHVAETPEGRIVGFCDGGKERSHPEQGIGELYAIYLLKDFQGQGTGRKLFNASIQSLVQSGMNSMVVWVMGKSPYRKFYETMRGKLGEGVKTLDVAGQQIQLVSYHWNDLKTYP